MSFKPVNYLPYDFANRRHIGPSKSEINDMLKVIGCESINELIKDIKQIIKPNQIILLKGSNGIGLWKLLPIFKNIIQENINAAWSFVKLY